MAIMDMEWSWLDSHPTAGAASNLRVWLKNSGSRSIIDLRNAVGLLSIPKAETKTLMTVTANINQTVMLLSALALL